ncbi:MAG: xanthine dehydrogenase family protein subunit M [Rhodospirillaceae bacterium]
MGASDYLFLLSLGIKAAVKAPKFRYVRPQSLSEAISLLSEFADEARILAGGQSLIPTLNMRLSQPEIVIDINKLDELKGISLETDHVRIGAMTRHVEVMGSALVNENLPLIAEALPYVAHVAVRNRGTFGGSIALADPAAEMPACILAMQAEIVLEGPKGRRKVKADDFFYGLYDTAMRPDEILIEVLLPLAKPGEVFSFMELSRRKGDFAQAGVACRASISAKTFEKIRLVYFGSELKPTVGKNVMTALEGQTWSENIDEKIFSELEDDLDPIDNLHGSAALKMHWQKVLTKRAIAAAVKKTELV